MDGQTYLLVGVAVGLFGWQGMPRWRQALRFAPMLALVLTALSVFVRIQLPPYIPPLVVGIGTTVAVLQVLKSSGRRR